MFEDWKLKRKIKKRTRSTMDVEAFCKKHNLSMGEDVTQGNTKARINVADLSMGMIALCICIFAIIAVVLFMPKNESAPLPELKYYGADMVNIDLVNEEQFFDGSVPVLLDFAKVEQHGAIFMAAPLDEELLLGYTVKEILYGFFLDNQLYAFNLELTIRCYEGYLFTGHDDFDNPMFEYNDECQYSIFEHNHSAKICVKKDNYEYFITAKEFEGITSIDKANIELLIQDIL